MDEYAEVIGGEATIEDYTRIALHFERSRSHFKAGKFFYQARHYSEVLQCILIPYSHEEGPLWIVCPSPNFSLDFL